MRIDVGVDAAGKDGPAIGLANEEIEQAYHQHRKDGAGQHDELHHGWCDDAGARVAGFLSHEYAVGRQRRQGQGSKSVHDEVDPQHLCHGEGRLLAEERADGDNQAGAHVDRKLEQDETLNVAVQGASPQDGLVDTGK